MALSRMKDGAKAEIERRFLLCKAWLLRVLGLLGDKSLMTLAWLKASARSGASKALLLAVLTLGSLRDKSLMGLAWMKAGARSGAQRAARALLLAVLALGFLRDKSLMGLAWMRAGARSGAERASRALLSALLKLGPFREKSLTVLTQVKGRASAEIERAFRRCKVWLFPAPERNLRDLPLAHSRLKGRGRTEVERAFSLCRASLAMIFSLSFFVNLLALTVPLYLLHIYDHVLASRSTDTLIMLTLIVVVALAVHATLEMLRRTMLARIGVWLDDRLQAPVLIAAVQAALRGDVAAAAQAWRDVGTLRTFFGGSACTALFDLPWTPIFLLAMVLVHPLLGAIGFVASAVLFGLAVFNELATRKPYSRSSAAWAKASTVSRRCCAMSRRSARWACCPASPGCCARTSPAPSRRSWPPRCAARRSRHLPASPASSPR